MMPSVLIFCFFGQSLSMHLKLQQYLIYTLYLTFLLGHLSYAKEPIVPLPQKPDYNEAKAQIGKQLFFDPRLSRDRNVSCASCHNFSYGGADKRTVSLGVDNRKGNIQSPTVLNARFNFRQFWNGRAVDLLDQAHGPLLNPKEMALSKEEITQRINASQKYRKLFKAVYHTDDITMDMVIDAIAEFEKALVTPNSKFDRYLRGEIALSPEEQEGYLNFKELGCVTCHNGINIGGNSFQKIGLFNPYPYSDAYPDRYSVTRKDYDKNVFKVPTLRNIALTAPYLHDGAARSLKEVIIVMSYHNLGYRPDDDKIAKIEAFLKTLTGEPPAILMEN